VSSESKLVTFSCIPGLLLSGEEELKHVVQDDNITCKHTHTTMKTHKLNTQHTSIPQKLTLTLPPPENENKIKETKKTKKKHL
jgi:hypothetical protein